MATSQSPIDRQPTKLDYASPTQFKFGILQLPKVEFFTVSANVPEISGTPAIVNTPLKIYLQLEINLSMVIFLYLLL